MLIQRNLSGGHFGTAKDNKKIGMRKMHDNHQNETLKVYTQKHYSMNVLHCMHIFTLA